MSGKNTPMNMNPHMMASTRSSFIDRDIADATRRTTSPKIRALARLTSLDSMNP